MNFKLIISAALLVASALAQAETATATFAGGCFWCVEADFDKVDGVLETVSGYAGGNTVDPSYREVVSGRTGHAEVVQITFDPSIVSFARLLETFWVNIDPTVINRQFCDSGNQYRTAIFFHDENQQVLAVASARQVAEKLGTTVHTQIVPLEAFYPAESYHQDYYKKNPLRYNSYRTGCGRDRRLRQIWSGIELNIQPTADAEMSATD